MLQIGKNRKWLGVTLLGVSGAVSVVALLSGHEGIAGTIMGGAFIAFGTLVSRTDGADEKESDK